MLGISGLAEYLLALKEGFCSMELVIFLEKMLDLLNGAVEINMAYNVTILINMPSFFYNLLTYIM